MGIKTKQIVLDQLYKSKTELSKKRKLGILQDIDSELDGMLQDFADYESIVESRLSVAIELEALLGQEYIKAQDLLDARMEINIQLEEYKTKANDLGVDSDTSYYDNALENLKTGIQFASSDEILKDLRF